MKKDGSQATTLAPGSRSDDFREAALKVIAEVPALIVSSGTSADTAIDECLARMGELFGASRSYVLMEEKDGRYLRNTYEWVNQKIVPLMYSWPLLDYEYDIPSVKKVIDDKEVIWGHEHDMEPDMREVLRKQGVKSIMLASMIRDGKRIGLVGLDYCAAECDKFEEFAPLLRFFSGILNLALERKQYQLVRSKLTTIHNTLADIEPMSPHEMESATSNSAMRPSKPMTLLDAERRIIIETLELYNGNKLKTARHLGLTWPSLDRRCKKLGIEVRRR